MKKLISTLLLAATLLALLPLSINVSATATPMLTTNKTTYIEGEPIIINAASTNASGKDWLGITVKGDATNAAIRWNYLTETTADFDIRKASRLGKNRNDLYSIPAGEYTVFIIPDDLTVKNGYDKRLASIDITVIPGDGSTETPVDPTYLRTDKNVYTVGEKILVSASHANANGTDWVGIFPKGETEGVTIYWSYLSSMEENYDISLGKKGKNMEAYYDLPAGEYTIVIIENDMTLKKGYATAPAVLDITIVEAAPETTAPEQDEAPDTGNYSPLAFVILAVISLAGITIANKKRSN